MNTKTLHSFLLLAVFFLVVFGILFVFPTGALGQGYAPLSPLPGTGESVDMGSIEASEGYLESMFKLGIGLAAVLAVIMIVIGGIQYVTSAAFNTKEEGKKRIWAALGGFILVLSSWLILNTINPDLLRFNFSKIRGGTGYTPSERTERFGESNITFFGARLLPGGDEAEITWNAVSADRCTISTRDGRTNITGDRFGTERVPISVTSTYEIICSKAGPDGVIRDSKDSTTVTIAPPEDEASGAFCYEVDGEIFGPINNFSTCFSAFNLEADACLANKGSDCSTSLCSESLCN